MVEPLSDRVIQSSEQAAKSYNRLVIMVAPAGSGKTAVLQEVHTRTGAPLINVNLELSRSMLDLTERQRSLRLPKLLSEIASLNQPNVVLLDNIEVLFHPSLGQDPLRLLQKESRNRTIVAAWSGSAENGYLYYARPDHPEYKRYPIQDFLLVHGNSE